MNPIPTELVRLADQWGATVSRDPENVEPNHGAMAGTDIWLGVFDDPDIERVAFFHELGHVETPRRFRHQPLSKISQEVLAWEIGLGLAKIAGYSWGYHSKELVWARGQLATYLDSEYNDLQRKED